MLLNIDDVDGLLLLLVVVLTPTPVPFHNTLLPLLIVGVVITTVSLSILFVVIQVVPLSIEYDIDCNIVVGTALPIVNLNIPSSNATNVRYLLEKS